MADTFAGEVGLVFDDRYLQHDVGLDVLWHPSGLTSMPFVEPVMHPSNYRLVFRAKQLIDLSGIGTDLKRVDAYPATVDALAVYHTREYIQRVKQLCEAGGGETGDGAPAGPGSYEIALLSAGGAMAAVDAVMDGAVRRVFANIRPPGHHALADKGMGYCIFNNVVVAARHAQREHGVERVLIVDWDVHDGNGTQVAFYDDPSVLFVSLHQDRLYPPKMGLLEQVGEGEGLGYTVNIPLPAGSGDATYRAAFERVVVPIADAFRPHLVMISAGQDASLADPEGRMALTSEAYREMTRSLMAVAERHCEGRLVVVQEGGYSETYAPYCSLAIVEALTGRRSGLREAFFADWVKNRPEVAEVGLSGVAALEAIVATHAGYWPSLRDIGI